MQPEVSKALSYWQVAMQYLDLSEKVAHLISSKGNPWVFIQKGFNLTTLRCASGSKLWRREYSS